MKQGLETAAGGFPALFYFKLKFYGTTARDCR